MKSVIRSRELLGFLLLAGSVGLLRAQALSNPRLEKDERLVTVGVTLGRNYLTASTTTVPQGLLKLVISNPVGIRGLQVALDTPYCPVGGSPCEGFVATSAFDGQRHRWPRMGWIHSGEPVVQLSGLGGELAVRVEWIGSGPDISGVGNGIEWAEGDV